MRGSINVKWKVLARFALDETTQVNFFGESELQGFTVLSFLDGYSFEGLQFL